MLTIPALIDTFTPLLPVSLPLSPLSAYTLTQNAYIHTHTTHAHTRARAGYATLQSLPPGQSPRFRAFLPHVHGVVYQLRDEDLRRLARREGGYQLAELEVETYDGWRARALAFVSSPLAQLSAEVAPTERYLKLLRDGAADHRLHPLHQAWLSSVATVPSVGLGPAYWDTPAKYVAWAFLAVVGVLLAGCAWTWGGMG